ncbi:hypothetical protein Tco_0260567 [Tanacetum coccineum]
MQVKVTKEIVRVTGIKAIYAPLSEYDLASSDRVVETASPSDHDGVTNPRTIGCGIKSIANLFTSINAKLIYEGKLTYNVMLQCMLQDAATEKMTRDPVRIWKLHDITISIDKRDIHHDKQGISDDLYDFIQMKEYGLVFLLQMSIALLKDRMSEAIEAALRPLTTTAPTSGDTSNSLLFRYVETEFPAIFYNDALTSEVALLCEPMVSPLNDNQIDFRISFDESDDEDYMEPSKDDVGGVFSRI